MTDDTIKTDQAGKQQRPAEQRRNTEDCYVPPKRATSTLKATGVGGDDVTGAEA